MEYERVIQLRQIEKENVLKNMEHRKQQQHRQRPIYEEVLQMLDIAIVAIKKQIPQKPVLVEKSEHYFIYDCPVCGEWTSYIYNHCTHCGQALDWEEDESGAE